MFWVCTGATGTEPSVITTTGIGVLPFSGVVPAVTTWHGSAAFGANGTGDAGTEPACIVVIVSVGAMPMPHPISWRGRATGCEEECLSAPGLSYPGVTAEN